MNRTITLAVNNRIERIAPLQARRFARLTGTANEIATEGIIRHLAACARHDVPPDFRAIREIIDDALNGDRIYAQIV